MCDLRAVLENTGRVLKPALGETIATQTSSAEDLWRARVDRGQLENALLNLAINARDAMPEGGRMTISAANMVVDESRARHTGEDMKPGDYVTLSVTDIGCGMPAEVVGRAFEPFFTTKDVGEGTGLGLSMVYGFAKQSGGHAELESTLNEGTTVRMYLPRAEAKAADEVPDEAVVELTRDLRLRRTVLVVEDHEDVREAVVSVVEDLGYEAVAAADGNEALRPLAGRSKIDPLFTDVVMPGGMTGRQLAEKAKERHPDLKVLFTSGHDLEDVDVHVLDPDTVLLRKPYQRTELRSRIQSLFNEE